MEKKSFSIYLDNYEWVCMLAAEDQGALLNALFLYALALNERDVAPPEFLKGEGAGLNEAVRLVFGFMAGNIYRDTQKWKQIQSAKAARREEKRLTAPPAGAGSVFPPIRGF